LWFEDFRRAVPTQQLNEFGQPALFIGAEVKMNVPAQIVLPKILIVLCAVADDRIERVEAEVGGLQASDADIARTDDSLRVKRLKTR
jgi:hypothetical protein